MSQDEELAAGVEMRRLIDEDIRTKASRRAIERLTDGFGERIRIMPVVEVLERRGTLSPRQAIAGFRIYQNWSLGIQGIRDGEPGEHGADPQGLPLAQIEAAREYRLLRDTLGPRLWPCAYAVCVEDWTPQRWANERGGGERMHKLGAVALLRVALDIAADVIGEP